LIFASQSSCNSPLRLSFGPLGALLVLSPRFQPFAYWLLLVSSHFQVFAALLVCVSILLVIPTLYDQTQSFAILSARLTPFPGGSALRISD